MKNHYTIKENALKLRGQGYSYNLISQKLGVAKGTLSYWFKDVPYTANKAVLKRIKLGPFISGRIRHERKLSSIEEITKAAKTELGVISERDLWMLGIGLYIGEGSKSYEDVRIMNSNPEIIKLAVHWFKKICKVGDKNLILTLHLYPDNNLRQSMKYWSNLTGIPLNQFRKSQIDTRVNKSWKKKNKLPYGTANVSVKTYGNPEFGVKLHRRIVGWIDGIFKTI
ncbi:MAG: hypothetical protein WCV73_04130 [Patescibacteria group bacterium]|jgi:hypothetical protein